MTYELRPLTAEQGEEMAQWRYPGPWAIYDVTGPLDPAEGFWSVLDGSGDVVGYACFGFEARVPGLEERPGVLDVGVGMRPDLTGQGRGREFAEAVLAHGHAVSGIARLRAVVQDWNARSRRLLSGLGFVETGTHAVGDVTYVVYERDA
jgi:[ribosomal protein S18]-alanine N-acetyltransferase